VADFERRRFWPIPLAKLIFSVRAGFAVEPAAGHKTMTPRMPTLFNVVALEEIVALSGDGDHPASKR
jgi:hypothetical protein